MVDNESLYYFFIFIKLKKFFCNDITFPFCLGIIVYCVYPAQCMINPWIDCGDDISCRAKKAGFNFPLRVDDYTVRAMGGMLEPRFLIDKGRRVIIRKAQTFDDNADENGIIDIFGDYNQYPINKTISLDNGVKFGVRGYEDNYKVVNFAAETGYYSIICKDGLAKTDIEHFYKLLAEAEIPSYSEEVVKTLEQLQDVRRGDNVVEPVFTQDCFSANVAEKRSYRKLFGTS